jgi:cytochrome c556
LEKNEKTMKTLRLVVEELEKIEKMTKGEIPFSKKELKASLNFAISRLYEVLIEMQKEG